MQRALPAGRIRSLVPPPRPYDYFHGWERDWRLSSDAGFSPRNAWCLAEASLLAYETGEQLEAAFLKSPLRTAGFRLEHGKSTQTGYFILRGEGVAVVSFRGTQLISLSGAVMDFATDGKFLLVPDRHGGLVHLGFRDALSSVWQDLTGSLRGDSAVILTGHSLGGALASLAAYWAACAQSFNVCALYTFGAPRIGNAEFAGKFDDKKLTAKSFRFVNNSDLVPELPPEGLYRHVGQSMYFDNAGHLRREAPPAGKRSGIRDALALLPAGQLRPGSDFMVPGPLADHAPIYYAVHAWNNFDRT
jgi:triacylglycerol lipase